MCLEYIIYIFIWGKLQLSKPLVLAVTEPYGTATASVWEDVFVDL